mgnify:FL=1
MEDFGKTTRRFLMGEWNNNISFLSRARAIKEALNSLKTRTIKDNQKIELALENLSHIRKEYRKLEHLNNTLLEENNSLTEKLKLLEEKKES